MATIDFLTITSSFLLLYIIEIAKAIREIGLTQANNCLMRCGALCTSCIANRPFYIAKCVYLDRHSNTLSLKEVQILEKK